MRKLKTKDEAKVIELFRNLLGAGFHLAEVVDFLERSRLLSSPYTRSMREGLLRGATFSEILRELRFSEGVTTQISLSERHGRLDRSLATIHAYLVQVQQVKKKLVEVATYPVLLLGFLMAIMVGMRQYLLPQLGEENVATWIIGHLPVVFLGAVGLFLLLTLAGVVGYRRASKLAAFTYLAKVPGLSRFVRGYLTAYYAREWGNLIDQGLELPEIVEVMRQESSPLMREMGEDLQARLLNGQSFEAAIRTYPFFKRELSLMIEYGQVKQKLGTELTLYAKESWDRFFFQIHQALQWIQPLVFLLVALMIVLIYVAMLLPIYQGMEF